MVTPGEVKRHMDDVWKRLADSWEEYKGLAAKGEYTEATRAYGTYADHMDAIIRLTDIMKKLKEDPQPIRRGAPREALPWYGHSSPQVGGWEIRYMLDSEPRTETAYGELGRLIARLEDYALYTAKALEIKDIKRVR